MYRDLRFPFGTLQRLFRGSVSMMERVGVPTGERRKANRCYERQHTLFY